MTGTWAEFYLGVDMFLCGHFSTLGGCFLCSPVVTFFLNTPHFPIFVVVVLPFSLCFQNLRVKNYSDGDWVSEDDLAKGINTKCKKILENVKF